SVTKDSREGEVGALRVDDQLADLAFLFPDVLPRLAAVRGLVDAVAGRHVAANVPLAGTDVDHGRVGGGHGDGSDGGDGLVVEDRLPGAAAVLGLPDAAGGGGRIVDQRIAGHTARAADSAARCGAEGAVLQVFEFRWAALVLVGVQGRSEEEPGEGY